MTASSLLQEKFLGRDSFDLECEAIEQCLAGCAKVCSHLSALHGINSEQTNAASSLTAVASLLPLLGNPRSSHAWHKAESTNRLF